MKPPKTYLLWYVAGAAMAADIESKLRRSGLIEIIRQGHDAFFAAYRELDVVEQSWNRQSTSRHCQ